MDVLLIYQRILQFLKNIICRDGFTLILQSYNELRHMFVLRSLLLSFLFAQFLPAQEVKSARNINDIPVFIYHRVGDSRFPSTNVSKEVFENHLKYLNNNDFNVVTLSDALAYVQQGRSAPEKTVVLTIDDGYRSFYENGAPLLEKYGFPVTVFINTRQVGASGFMGWKELNELIDRGIEIHNHSHSHDYFVNYDLKTLKTEFRNDLEKSHRIFKEKLGYVPEIFSYPFGEFNPEMKEILKEFGYLAAVGQHSGVISENSDKFNLPRFPMTGIYASLEKFQNRVNMKSLPAELLNKLGNPIVDTENPPELRIKLLKPDLINTESLQCFVAGSSDCRIEYDQEKELIIMKANSKLENRRTLYTITGQSTSVSWQWYWWSFLWVIPDIKE